MDTMTRQLRGCGFLPRIPNAAPWFEIPDVDIDRDEVTVCPGYAIGLNEVAEAVHYRPSWSKGYLAEHLGEPPTHILLDAENALEGAINAKQAKDIKDRRKDGGNGD